jgi:hypothetical protein
MLTAVLSTLALTLVVAIFLWFTTWAETRLLDEEQVQVPLADR